MNAEALEVVRTIWKQIPITSKMACGMREQSIVALDTLRVRVARGIDHLYLKIRLDPNDTYTVMLVKARPRKPEVVVKELSDVYFDMLGEITYNFVNKP
jgi:hypothetical protein